MFLYSKVNWESIREDLRYTLSKLKEIYENRNVDQMWEILKSDIKKACSNYIPTKVIKCKHILPWISSDLRRNMYSYM